MYYVATTTSRSLSVGRPKKYKNDKELFIGTFLNNSRNRALSQGVPFDLTFDYLMSITTDFCPIFKTPFVWKGFSGGKGKSPNDSPTLDKIIPELGYVQGNVAFISRRANKMKDDGTMQEHYDIADWIWSHTHAKENTTTPISEGAYIQGAVGAELGSVSTPWTWEDDDNAHNHSGTVSGEDLDHRAQEGSGNSVGRGGKEVATSEPFTRIKDNGEPDAEIVRLDFGSGHLPDKP